MTINNPHLKLLNYSAGWRIEGDPNDDANVIAEFTKALRKFEDKYQIDFEEAKIHPAQASTDLYIRADDLGIELSEDPRRSIEGSIWFYSSQLTHKSGRHE